MPSVTYDGQSFMLNGRRIWLVSGSLHYARIVRDQWADRIHAARLAGLNTVEAPVFWARHEGRPGHFDFKGDNDLRHFVKLIGQAGMYCILRPGPYVGAEWDLGGLPAWLLGMPNIKVRTNSGPFLEACSRYLSAVADQVRDLQITSSGAGGPIILVQNENAWTCGHDDLGRAYLGELNRYLREAGVTVPIIDANNLWQGVEGEIDCWSGSRDMLAALRQLATVRPDQPRVVIDFAIGRAATWGAAALPAPDPSLLQRRLAELLAGGGQFNLQPFCGGTNFGFSAGRSPESHGAFFTASNDRGAPVSEDGSAGGCYREVRRIATFASRFARVLSNLSPQYQPVVIDPSDHAPQPGRRDKAPTPAVHGRASVVHTSGSQGGVAFVFADLSGDGPRQLNLLLPDGSSLPVDLSGQSVVWCLFDAHIGGRASLDYCTLCAFASLGKTFVCFGPAGARGAIAINGSPIDVTVPAGKSPQTVELEGVTVVICSQEQIDATFIADDAVYVGVKGLTPDGRPILDEGAPGKSFVRIDAAGKVTLGAPTVKRASAPEPGRVVISPWSWCSTSDYTDGTSARYATVPGPGDLGAMGSTFGYGWYRITPKAPGNRRARACFPQGSDRLHVFQDGRPAGLTGVGPGADSDVAISTRKTTVVLAENFGRFSGGIRLDDRKGLFGHAWEVAPVRVGKPRLVHADPLEPLAFRAPLWELRRGDATLPERVTWSLAHRKRTPLILTIGTPEGRCFPGRALLLLNDTPIDFLDRSGPYRTFIEPAQMGRGAVTLQVALLPESTAPDGALEHVGDPAEMLKVLSACVRIDEARNNLTAKAEWAFARWELPPGAAYQHGGRPKHIAPTWWRCHFKVSSTNCPLYLELDGMTKGQIYVNGRHLGRYFAATADGTPVGPQKSHLIPCAWLKSEDNELTLFDEHVGHPSQCRLVHRPTEPIVAASA